LTFGRPIVRLFYPLSSVRCSRWASCNTWRLFLIPCCSAMRQSFKSLADGDDGMSLIDATASMWAKVEICCMECVAMDTSITRSLAVIASRSRSLIRRSHTRWILELCAGFSFLWPSLGDFSGKETCGLLYPLCQFVHRISTWSSPVACSFNVSAPRIFHQFPIFPIDNISTT